MRSSIELFQASPAFKDGHYETMLNSTAFEPACAAALAALVESLPGSATEPSKAWDSYLQILGARAVLQMLSQLHQKSEPLRADPPQWKYSKINPTPKGP